MERMFSIFYPASARVVLIRCGGWAVISRHECTMPAGTNQVELCKAIVMSERQCRSQFVVVAQDTETKSGCGVVKVVSLFTQ